MTSAGTGPALGQATHGRVRERLAKAAQHVEAREGRGLPVAHVAEGGIEHPAAVPEGAGEVVAVVDPALDGVPRVGAHAAAADEVAVGGGVVARLAPAHPRVRRRVREHPVALHEHRAGLRRLVAGGVFAHRPEAREPAKEVERLHRRAAGLRRERARVTRHRAGCPPRGRTCGRRLGAKARADLVGAAGRGITRGGGARVDAGGHIARGAAVGARADVGARGNVGAAGGGVRVEAARRHRVAAEETEAKYKGGGSHRGSRRD